jgi:hypothetical protein
MATKAYAGFAAARHDPKVGGHETMATGHWGCGAFKNNEKVMFVVQSLAADLAGVRLRYHLPPVELTGGRGVDLAPATAMLEEARAQKLSVREALERLEQRCATDEEWRTKWRPPKPKAGRRSWWPSGLWRKGDWV